MLVTCEIGFEDKAMEQIAKLPCVEEVNRVTGVYDIVVKLAGSDLDLRTASACTSWAAAGYVVPRARRGASAERHGHERRHAGTGCRVLREEQGSVVGEGV